MSTTFIGQALSRVDGRQKVTGHATYAAEFDVPGQAYGAIVRSTIANGRIATIDTEPAERVPGVLAVLTYRNAPKLAYGKDARGHVIAGRLRVLQDDAIYHQGQPIALVVAQTLEQAGFAATLVRAGYTVDDAITDIHHVAPALPTKDDEDEPPEVRRGDTEAALSVAEVAIDQEYVIPRENHNPIELHATIASWDGARLTLWDKTQWVSGVADRIAAVFGIPREDVRVISPFVGGAFGSGLRTWPHVTLAALGARVVQRPVKIVLSRREMYYGTGFRPYTTQRVVLGASREGRLTAITHDAVQENALYEEYVEAVLDATRFMYSCPNVYTRYRLAPMNVHAPTWMRAPGEASGVFALECAMDELAVRLKMDPVELRLRNEPAYDEHEKSTVLEPLDSRMLSRGGGAFWLEPPQSRAAVDAGRRCIDRLGHGCRNVSCELWVRIRVGAAVARWSCRSRERRERYGPGHMDVDDAGGSRDAGLADRSRDVYSGRFAVAADASAWRFDDDGQRGERGPGRLSQGTRGSAFTRRRRRSR